MVLATFVFSLLPVNVLIAGAVNDPKTVDLLAGQDIKVGEVTTWNDSENVYVKYEITEEDWCIIETHVHVGEDLDDFPLAGRWNNPVPGQFDYKAEHDCVSEYTETVSLGDWNSDDELKIAAHAVVEKEECEILAEAPYTADEVIEDEQGLRYDYTPVRTQRSNPDAVLTFATGSNEANFFSLGFQEDRVDHMPAEDAWIIIRFDYPILNGPGDDLQVIEDTWGLPYPDETANVWVSQYGNEWEYLGEANNQDPWMSYHTITDFDLEDVSLDWVSFVKVQDTSSRADFDSRYPGQKDTLDGYDLNAVIALNDHKVCKFVANETAWAHGERFTEKGNWATYFSYEIQEQYIFQEIIEVDSSKIEGANSEILDEDETYKFIASGTWKNSNLHTLDAECRLNDGDTNWELSVPRSLRLQVNEKYFTWGNKCADDHVYQASFTGGGEQINFRINDGNPPVDSWYSDNSGHLTVEIYKKVW
jgi:hypothetical protein